jgi:hypothetical protein
VVKRSLEKHGPVRPEAMTAIDEHIAEFNENVHTTIEDSFQPKLSSMLRNELGFLNSPEGAAAFFYELAVQYARTNHIKRMRKLFDAERFALYTRIANVLTHIVATNVGHSLYATRKKATIMLLDNYSNVPFITADQPVINIAANPKDTSVPTSFDLYYPLSPTKALLVLEPLSARVPTSSSISSTAARIWNLQIAAHSNDQVFASSRQELENVNIDLPAFLRCF